MPNKNYVKGRRKEYKICAELRKEGFRIVQRTAGSHSPIDIIAIDPIRKFILFVQSKPDSMPDSEQEKIRQEWIDLNNQFICKFEVR